MKFVRSTFGGNPLASAVAIAALEVIKEERLTERYQYPLQNLLLSTYIPTPIDVFEV